MEAHALIAATPSSGIGAARGQAEQMVERLLATRCCRAE
jgi:hypothetical protein